MNRQNKTLLQAFMLAWLLSLVTSVGAWAQGVLIIVNHPHPVPLPRPIIIREPTPPPISYRVKELTVQATVKDQIAKTQVTQSFVNSGSTPIEVSFCFPLPYDGAIDRLTFLVDGQEIEGKLLPAEQAKSIYQSYVRQNKDPALLEWVGYGMFKTSVFPVPAGAERKVTLRYNQLLRKQGRLVDYLFPLSPAKYTSQPIEKLSVEISIDSSEKIKSVYSPTHPINIKRPDEKHATISWEASQVIPNGDLRLFYDTDPGKVSASLISYRPDKNQEGFFVLLASPEFKVAESEVAKKTVILVCDRSGSMSGKKIEQAKEALRFVLNNLRDGDLFNVIAYDSEVTAFKPELQAYNEQSRQEALGFVDGIYAGGSTNIDQSLTTALTMLQDNSRPNYVIFMTDGLPTVGEKNEAKIAANAREKNQVRARILSFGVGYDVNSRLLDRLVYENFGISQYVRPDEDIEQHVSNLYARMSAPVMMDVSVNIDVEGVTSQSNVNRMYPTKFNDLFAGEQLVLVGRYRQPGNAKIVMKGKIGGSEQTFDFPGQLVEHSPEQSMAFVEKLWAMRRIGEIIDEIDLKGRNEELIKELVDLSTTHGILTPYTAFLADENRRGDLASTTELYFHAEREVQALDRVDGRNGVAQRAEKQFFKDTPLADAGVGGGGFGLAEPADATAPASGAGVQTGPARPGGRMSAMRSRGSGGMMGGAARRSNLNAARYLNIESDEYEFAEGVANVGNQTLYKRGKMWIAANARDVDLEKDKEKLVEVERFSDEYFKLVDDNNAEENLVLASQADDEELLIRLRDQVYLIK